MAAQKQGHDLEQGMSSELQFLGQASANSVQQAATLTRDQMDEFVAEIIPYHVSPCHDGLRIRRPNLPTVCFARFLDALYHPDSTYNIWWVKADIRLFTNLAARHMGQLWPAIPKAQSHQPTVRCSIHAIIYDKYLAIGGMMASATRVGIRGWSRQTLVAHDLVAVGSVGRHYSVAIGPYRYSPIYSIATPRSQSCLPLNADEIYRAHIIDVIIRRYRPFGMVCASDKLSLLAQCNIRGRIVGAFLENHETGTARDFMSTMFHQPQILSELGDAPVDFRSILEHGLN